MRTPSLGDRVAIVTGASAGIGRAAAEALAARGAAVVVAARRQDRLDGLAAEIRGRGGRALAVVADVAVEADVDALVEAALREYGRLDVMVCNAGYGVNGSLEEVPTEQMRALLEVNYLGTWHGARAALPVFRRQQAGHLIIVSSIVGRRGAPYMGAYCATKFAQVGLAESLRAELAGTPIHVSLVYPVATDTEFQPVMQAVSGGRAFLSQGPHQSAERVGRAIADCVERPVVEVFPYRPARGLVLLSVIAPRFVDRMMRRYGRRRA